VAPTDWKTRIFALVGPSCKTVARCRTPTLGTPKPLVVTARGGPGSLADLVADYYRSPGFANLEESSKSSSRKAINPILLKHGHRIARDLPRDKAMKIIVEIGERRPGMANLTKKVLKTVFKFAIKTNVRESNPFDNIDAYKGGRHHTWTDDELAVYEKRWPLGTRERLAYAVLLYTCQRVSDAAKINRASIRNNSIRVVQKKTAEDDDDMLWIEMHPALVRAIEAGPTNGLTVIGSKVGRPILGTWLSDIIKRVVRLAGLPPRCVAHGLRRAGMRRLAEHGATTKEIAAVSGHKSLKEIEMYVERASRAKLSKRAIEKLPDETGSGT
jgi:integrase